MPTNIDGNLYSDLLLLALVNEAGIHVGETGTIDAANLVLSTRDITDSNFVSGDYVFEKMSKEYIDMLLLNEGKITIRDGGFGVLIAGAIEKETASELVGMIGHIAIFYRQQKDPEKRKINVPKR